MSESENALPLDESFWEHIEHMIFNRYTSIRKQKMLDILYVLHDIYDTIDADPEEAKCILALAGILVGSSTSAK
jgi:hypothetical protein